MSIVHKEMQSIQHLFVIPYKRHFKILINNFSKFWLSFIFLVNKLNLSLFLTFFQQKVAIPYNLVRLLYNLVDIRCLAQEFSIVFLIIF